VLAGAYDVIGIDEAHFFDDLAMVVSCLKSLGKTVVIAALNGDVNLMPLKPVADLIPRVNFITLCTAACYRCNVGKATSTYRDDPVSTSKPFYVALCDACYQDARISEVPSYHDTKPIEMASPMGTPKMMPTSPMTPTRIRSPDPM